MSEVHRRHAARLMRDALALLDRAGEQRASLHLQLALDLLDDLASLLGPEATPTCH